MIGWIVDKLIAYIPFLHERAKSISGARARLSVVKTRLVSYAVLGKFYTGECDIATLKWAREQVDDYAGITDLAPLKRMMDMIGENEEALRATLQIYAPKQGYTNFFPPIDKPTADIRFLSAMDTAILAEVNGHIEAINSLCASIQGHHDKTFDNSMSDAQMKTIKDSIFTCYRGISAQAYDAACKVSAMDIMSR